MKLGMPGLQNTINQYTSYLQQWKEGDHKDRNSMHFIIVTFH
jgi:hypothetical protein